MTLSDNHRMAAVINELPRPFLDFTKMQVLGDYLDFCVCPEDRQKYRKRCWLKIRLTPERHTSWLVGWLSKV